jgi:hypothetical protein
MPRSVRSRFRDRDRLRLRHDEAWPCGRETLEARGGPCRRDLVRRRTPRVAETRWALAWRRDLHDPCRDAELGWFDAELLRPAPDWPSRSTPNDLGRRESPIESGRIVPPMRNQHPPLRRCPRLVFRARRAVRALLDGRQWSDQSRSSQQRIQGRVHPPTMVCWSRPQTRVFEMFQCT